MINFQNITNDRVVECRVPIKTTQGKIIRGTRGIIRSSWHELPKTVYRIEWPNPEPLELAAVFTGAGGDFDDPYFSNHTHDDPHLSLVSF